ncbi:hypothetical protein L202_03692 [Cryptococcus amylolentus CBS 6039]|uniref:Vacuolar sorting protein Vps3844 C-terminal domain-containing protein n=2 Tax=Cryptococcus amylolentus TaxID=104669 RepID=A0A1E3HTW5_9TREE|nr:hypothetical protein L202_03692 [Cryptococcus amylolentus CBS 6039]ODN79784.1 hypothetical protein L202_03692 [Cryptococcus amylolentus CBS 6039]ODO08068.1 hypothetical protein I350_03651 [Cryptococcus amylolentus CBS 6273]
MRIPVLATLSAALLPLSYARSAQEHLQVYLHPAPQTALPPSHASPPTLSYNQAKAVLSHHLKQDISDFDEIPEDESHWAHLMGLWEGDEGVKAKVVVIDGGVDAQDVLPASLSSNPTFYLEDNVQSHHLLEPYMHEARNFLAHVIEAFPAFSKTFQDLWNVAGTKASEVLSQELAGLTALSDSLSLTSRDGSYPWEAARITGLRSAQKNGEAWETGRQTIQAGLESMTSPGSPPLLLIIRPASSKRIISRSTIPLTSLTVKSNTTLAAACYTSNETCSESTSCNGRGACALKSAQDGTECWGCKCRGGYAGVECQKDDYSTSFIILIFSTLLLLGLAGGSIALLYTIGETKLPSTLTLAVGGSKRN